MGLGHVAVEGTDGDTGHQGRGLSRILAPVPAVVPLMPPMATPPRRRDAARHCVWRGARTMPVQPRGAPTRRIATGAGATGAVSGSRAQSMTNRLWESMSAHVYVFLHQTRLSDVVQNELTPCPAVPTLFEVVDEG